MCLKNTRVVLKENEDRENYMFFNLYVCTLYRRLNKSVQTI